jgi:plasmid replication initiation protein
VSGQTINLDVALRVMNGTTTIRLEHSRPTAWDAQVAAAAVQQLAEQRNDTSYAERVEKETLIKRYERRLRSKDGAYTKLKRKFDALKKEKSG